MKTSRGDVKALKNLYKIVEAGERGFAVAATSVDNRGLKVTFKTFAQQRAQFKSELLDKIQRLGGDHRPRSSIRGLIHRGRIAIVASLTIGSENQEKVVLKEAVIGEEVAEKTYKKTLGGELSPELREIVERQFEEVRKVREQVHLMRGKGGKRLVVRLFNSEEDADRAVGALKESGFSQEAVERVSLSETMELYEGKGTTVLETVLSGAFGGSLWGSLIGVLAGISVVQLPGVEPIGTTTVLGTGVFIALAIVLIAAFVGGALGLIFGVGISEEDTEMYDQSVRRGQIILKVLVDEAIASKANQIMSQVNIQSRAQAREAPA